MTKQRLEAFSDGVIAIIITIMVLELRPPQGVALESLRGLAPVLGSYVLSFVFVGIYWNNHHHLLHATHSVTGRVLWANLYLLFWLSLIPFGTAWLGQSRAAPWPTAIYGFVLFMAGGAYQLLEGAILAHQGPGSQLAAVLGERRKEWLSVTSYLAAIVLAFVSTWLSLALYVAVAALWFTPDRRIEHGIRE
ncbi:MAG TPA: TMEM175 family protein [Myxococcota bacterium]|nr:TMEM175 family protein [Myxococcota bacterium]